MRQLFQIDGAASMFVRQLVSTVYLNLLWIICSIPIVTIGASTTALFYVSQKLCKNEEGNIAKDFFHSFRTNFKQSTIIWLILLVVGILLGADGYILYHMRYHSAFWTILTAILIVAAVAYAIVLMYIFPLLAHFENTTKAMFLNSIMIGMRFLLCSFFMAVVYLVMGILIVFIYTPFIIFGMGICAFICSHILSGVIQQCEGKTDERQTNKL